MRTAIDKVSRLGFWYDVVSQQSRSSHLTVIVTVMASFFEDKDEDDALELTVPVARPSAPRPP
jgi:hypothetical protein